MINRHNDSIKLVKDLIRIDFTLNQEERELLSHVYKSKADLCRSSLRTVRALLDNESICESENRKSELIKLRFEISKELQDICQDIVSILDDMLIPNAKNPEFEVYYIKLKADYYRYWSESCLAEEKERLAKLSREFYISSLEKSSSSLSKDNPIYLGSVLNYTVFLFEIAGEKKAALDLLVLTYNSAPKNDEESEEKTRVLQTMKDNITLWSEEQGSVN